MKYSKYEEKQLAEKSSLNKKLMFRDWLINPTIHACAQAHLRRPDFDINDWKIIHSRMMAYIINNVGQIKGDYVFFSKSLNQGYVVEIINSKKRINIVTVLPKGRSQPKNNTEKVIIENRVIIDIIELE